MNLQPGHLPAGAADQMAQQVASWKSSGRCSGVEIIPGPGCNVAESQKGVIYPFDSLPDLPLDGCFRQPCCGCCYAPAMVDSEQATETTCENGKLKMSSWKKRLALFGVLWATIVFTSLILSGCASHGVIVSEQQVQQFKRGETTEAQVIAALGQPTTVTSYNGQRMIVYSGAHAQARPASFIPFIGPFVGGADVKASSVIFRVTDGVVTDIISSQTASGSGTGMAAGAPIDQVSDQPR